MKLQGGEEGEKKRKGAIQNCTRQEEFSCDVLVDFLELLRQLGLEKGTAWVLFSLQRQSKLQARRREHSKSVETIAVPYHDVRYEASGKVDEDVTNNIHTSLSISDKAVRLALDEAQRFAENVVALFLKRVLASELLANERDLGVGCGHVVHHLQVAPPAREDEIGPIRVVRVEARVL